MTDPDGRNPASETRERELAQYTADMLLELRKMAKATGLTTLLGLLELSYCEAYAIANKVNIPDGEIEKLKRLAKAAGEG